MLVYIPGVWDMLHVGHVAILTRAKALGSHLTVGVPDDGLVAADKGRPPICTLAERMGMLEALRCVDRVAPYGELSFLPHLDLFKPDIIAVGSTWGCEQRHRLAEKWARKNNATFITLPYTSSISTSDIAARVLRRHREATC